jgi:membrane associated rhomboid family serine protease
VGDGPGDVHAGGEALSEEDRPDASPVAVRVAPSRARAEEWAVVLAAVDVPCAVREELDGWTVLVAPADAVTAVDALESYERENAAEAAARPSAGPPPRPVTFAGVYVALLLLAVFALSGARVGRSEWFVRGSADAAKIMAGEWWRAVTALTLHADAAHVLGNAIAAALLVSLVCQAVGLGVGLVLVLLAGTLGNLAAALAQRGAHVPGGASTAIFGAIGILAALRVVTPERVRLGARRPWVILAATLVLLVVFGVGPDVDVLGHLFGLLAGLGDGLLGALGARRPPPPAVQWVLAIAAAAALAGAWRLAF